MRIEEMRIETKEHYRITVLEDRIEELEEEVTTLRKITQDLRMGIDTLKEKEEGDRSERKKEEHNKSEKNDAKEFFKKLEIITKVLGRKLRLEEALLLTIFESLEIDGDEKKPEPEKMHEFKKTSECYTCRNFSKVFEKPEDVRKRMGECCCDKKEKMDE